MSENNVSEKPLEEAKITTSNSRVLAAVASETMVLTGLAAILFLWGKVYYNNLIGLLGFDSALFEIPIYDVMFVSWNKLFVGVLFAFIFVALQSVSGMLLLSLHLVIRVLEWIWGFVPEKVACWVWTKPLDRLKIVASATNSRIPKFIRLEIEKSDELRLLGLIKFIIALSVVIAGIEGAKAEAQAVVDAYKQGKSPKRHMVFYDGISEKPIDGVLVKAIGDMVIVDVALGDSAERLLLRSKDMKKIIWHPQKTAPSIPELKAAELPKK